jgi:hypothetical protein
MKDLDYYGITREDIDSVFLQGSRKKILNHANGLIAESKRQMDNNNCRFAALHLSIAQLMIEYVNDEDSEDVYIQELPVDE